MWSWPLPCGWSTLDWSCRGQSSETKTCIRRSTGAYLVSVHVSLCCSFVVVYFLLFLCNCETPLCFGLSFSDAFSQIIANEGVGTLWNGTLPSLILVLNPAVQFMFYEAMKRKAGKGGRKVKGHKKPSFRPGLLTIFKAVVKNMWASFSVLITCMFYVLTDYFWGVKHQLPFLFLRLLQFITLTLALSSYSCSGCLCNVPIIMTCNDFQPVALIFVSFDRYPQRRSSSLEPLPRLLLPQQHIHCRQFRQS